jgi:hypothetical protein
MQEMDHYLFQSLQHRQAVPRHDASLEAIRAALFAFFGAKESSEPTGEQIARDVDKTSFAKTKVTLDKVLAIEEDAVRRVAKRRKAAQE